MAITRSTKAKERSDLAVLATSSATLAMGLGALLLSIPPIKHVECVTDSRALLDSLAEVSPMIIILDTDLAEFEATPESVREASPQVLRVLLSDNMAEFRELLSDSQDTVVIKGADPGRLARTFEYLLNNRAIA